MTVRRALINTRCVRLLPDATGVDQSSLAGRTAGQLGDDVEVADVARVLLQQVEQHPFECRGIGTVPSRAGSADLV